MRTVKILHMADMHIGAAESFLKSAASPRRFETLLTFEKIIAEAERLEVDLIAIAGDLFDSNKIEPTFAESVFARISASKIPVVFAAGNHDPLNGDSPFLKYDLPKNLYVLGVADECITFEDLKLKVYGRSFESAFLKGEECFSLKADDDYINIMVQHGELKSDRNSDYNAITPAFVKGSGMDYIALGHIHKRSEIGRIGNTFFAYCGCPEGQGFDELDQKGVYVGEIGKGRCELSFLEASRRKHIILECDVTGLKSNGEINDKILELLRDKYGEAFAENLYKIKLVGSISPESEILTQELEARLNDELYFAKVRDNTEWLLNLEVLAEENSLKGVFVKRMLALTSEHKQESELYKKALSLGLKAFKGEVKYNED